MFHISPLLLTPLSSQPPNITGFPLYISIAATTLGYLSDATSRADPVLVSNKTVLPVKSPLDHPPVIRTVSPSPTQLCPFTPTVSLGHSLHPPVSSLYPM